MIAVPGTMRSAGYLGHVRSRATSGPGPLRAAFLPSLLEGEGREDETADAEHEGEVLVPDPEPPLLHRRFFARATRPAVARPMYRARRLL